MYSYEQRKRRVLINIIKILCFLIIVLVVINITKKDYKAAELSCKLVADKESINGVYTEPITISIEVSGKKNIISKNVGIYQNARRNRDKYVLSSNGTTTLVGYVEDEEGVSAVCLGTFDVKMSSPSCELYVLNGTLGLNDWYTSDVAVSFSNMSSNRSNVKISKYSITKSIKDINNSNELSTFGSNNDLLEIKENGNFEIIGRVEDEQGKTGECKLDVSIDKEPPVCELQIINRETDIGSDIGIPVVVGFKTADDEVSDMSEKGVGLKKNYKYDTYSISSYGTYIVYGYVKDNAGNENVCEFEVTTLNSKKDENESSNDVFIINNDIRNKVRDFFEK